MGSGTVQPWPSPSPVLPLILPTPLPPCGSTSSCRAALKHSSSRVQSPLLLPSQLPQAASVPALLGTRAGPPRLQGLPQARRAPSLSEGFPAGETPSDCSAHRTMAVHVPNRATQNVLLHLQTCSGPGHSQVGGNSWAAPKRSNVEGMGPLLTPLCPLSAGTAPGGRQVDTGAGGQIQFAGMHPTKTAGTAVLGSSNHTVCQAPEAKEAEARAQVECRYVLVQVFGVLKRKVR